MDSHNYWFAIFQAIELRLQRDQKFGGRVGPRALRRETQQAAEPEAVFTRECPRPLSRAGHTALLAPHGPKTPGVLGFGGQSPQG